jgi:putative oxidoreductase
VDAGSIEGGLTMTVAWELLIVRVVVGLTLTAHGAQKLLGWFGGAGYARTRQGFHAQGFRSAALWLGLAILGEVGGGLSLVFGFLTPLGAAGAVGAMAVAINSHWAKGFFAVKGGFEYPLTLLVVSAAIGIAGPGPLSLDAFLKPALPEVPTFLTLSVVALLTAAAAIAISRTTKRAEAIGSAAHPA